MPQSVSPSPPVDASEVKAILHRALAEDIGLGDITTAATLPPEARLEGQFLAKQPGVLAGLEVARLTFALVDERVQFSARAGDGDPLTAGQVFGTVSGPGRALLSAERVALNCLQRMSGIATLTRQIVDAVQGTRAVILDTRKTAPGLRALDKWAVRLGGGQNHRRGLYDMVLIKDNHIAAVGGLSEAVRRVRAADAHIALGNTKTIRIGRTYRHNSLQIATRLPRSGLPHFLGQQQDSSL